MALEHQEVRVCDVMEMQFCVTLAAKHRNMCHTWPNSTLHATVSQCNHAGNWKSSIMHVPYRKLKVAQCKQQCGYGSIMIRPALMWCPVACLLYKSASMDCTGMMCFRVIGSTSFFLMGNKAGLAHLRCLQPDTLPEYKVKLFAGCTELML